MKYVYISLIYFLSFALSAGTVNYLEVDGSTVLFSTESQKSHSIPDCVAANNGELWSISLASAEGRAAYSLILTAMASGEEMALSVEPLNNCDILEGIEQAGSVTIASQDAVVETPDAPDTTAAVSHPLQGTVFFNAAAVHKSNLFNGGNNIAVSNSSYFVTESRSGRFTTGRVTNSSRTLLMSLSGSGWLTSIVTPELAYGGSVTVEIVVDGESYTRTGVVDAYSERIVMGVLEAASASVRSVSLVTPAVAVSKGMGVPYNESLQVWLTIEASRFTGVENYWEISHIRGLTN